MTSADTATATTIAPASTCDIEAMTALLCELFSMEADFCPDPAAQRRGLAMMLDNPDRFVAVARAEGRVVGMGTAQVVISTAQGGPAALMEDLVVAESRRGQGLGRRITAVLEDWAASRGATRIQLLADRENAPALAFYDRTGWTATRLVCLRKTGLKRPY